MGTARKKGPQKPTQKNIVDVKEPKSAEKQFNGAGAGDLEVQDFFPEIRQPVSITKYDEHSSYLKIKTVSKNHKNYKYARVLGAAGPQLIPEMKLKEVSDPLLQNVREDLTKILLQDPIAAPAARYSIGAIFEDGFDLKFTLASQFSDQLKRQMTPEEIDLALQTNSAAFFTFLKQLDTWKEDCDVEQLAKDLHGVSLAQGKAAGMMLPGILDLGRGELPKICEIVPADDLDNPIIDVGDTRKVVAVKLDINDKDRDEDEDVRDLLRADELVYYVIGIRGLRREAKYHGVSPLEPVLQISKAIKRSYHLDAPLAMVAAYITKQLVKVSKENLDDALPQRVTNFMTKLFKADTWAMAMPDWYEGVDQIHTKVDWDMFDGVEQKLATAEITGLGVPKSALNREQGLNRDIATIQAIQFVRFIRKPAEGGLKKVLENQVFNPLLAHLAGKKLKEIPVRIEIVRKIPEGGDIDAVFDNQTQEKSQDMTDGNLQQNQAKALPETAVMPVVGAAGQQKLVQLQDEIKELKQMQRDMASGFMKKELKLKEKNADMKEKLIGMLEKMV